MTERLLPPDFLHLRQGTREVPDEIGDEFATLDALHTHMLTSARDLIVGYVRGGVLDLRFRIDAENDAGQVVCSLPFDEALTIIRGEAVDHAG